jgi:CheY-like chemotaxis protein
LRRTIPESVDISVNLTATPAYVDADPTQIEQILMNLSVNARDAMLDGGRLEIVTKVHEVGSEFANQRSGLRPGSYVILSVCDTGIGMPPEVRDHVFEPFYTTKERGHGTGLGLATVYGIVDRLGGHIDVRSAPGEGTTMEVYLPSSDQASDVEEEPVRPGRPAGGESILVAEDESAVRNLVERILVREGYRVVVAPSGKHALVIAQGDEPIDMLLTDVVMPEMSGKELAERIEELRPDLPTLFMSGYTGEIVARHGILQEGEALIQKPFDAKELLARVRETLDRDGRGGNVVTLDRESAVARPS